MESSKVELVVPQDLKILLEGVSRAVIQNNTDDIAEFIALYFQDLVALRTENSDLDITELINKFEYVRGKKVAALVKSLSPSFLKPPLKNRNEELEEKISEHLDTLFSGKPEKREKCTDTEEDQLLEEPDIEYSSQQTQYPSVASSIAETISSTGYDGASAPEGPELAYVPADPAQLAAHVLAMASSEAAQPPLPSNVWTLYCLTDLRQGQKSPPSLPPDGAGVPCSQAPLCLSRGEDQQYGQLSEVPAPIYVMQEESKRGNAPPFILVGSNVQNTEDWRPIPSYAVVAQQHTGVRRRFTTVLIPVARPAAEETDTPSPSSNPAEEAAAKLCPPDVFSVAIPLDDVMSAKKRLGSW
ncbi:PREDICTED: calcium-binding tyrosine phosphorylation-regulated protein [Pterocles gutturalis]|uniref:calcium-binding tyrosine phosphorylation-regulated protein n=1 Tax=Pterocles gutturalis TaxID=240206 RepID=UPI0005285572|nr:PREDICTED: calcium-binding tyrosine phosphorylation-regulated protein [Pterocles gutturalis]